MKFSELIRVMNNHPWMSNHPRMGDHPRGSGGIGLLDFFGDEEADLSQPRFNSNEVRPGDAFFAIKGYTTDGHKFIHSAIENGAKVVVLDEDNAFSRDEAERLGVTRILVHNSRKALSIISEAVFDNPSTKLRLIGVTGTNGKTTVTNIIKQLLEARGERVGLIGTIGISIGDREIEATHTTPESRDISELLARMVREGVTTCVMEVSSHALYLDRVFALDFDIAVFTNLTQDHLDFHRTMEDYFLAKQMLFNHLKDVAVAVSNADDAYGERMIAQTVANSHTYGIKDDSEEDQKLGHADLLASDVELSVSGSTFNIRKRYSDESAMVKSSLVGEFNVENILAAMSALYFGVEGFSLEVLSELVPKVKSVRGRFETITMRNGVTVIIDYAHTPDALLHVLETIRSLTIGKVITVFGCGGDRDRSKRPEMGRIASQFSDQVIVTSDNPRSEDPEAIIDEIYQGLEHADREKLHRLTDRHNAIEHALEIAEAGDVVLVAGKGHETYQLVQGKKHHFDDREEVMRWQNRKSSEQDWKSL